MYSPIKELDNELADRVAAYVKLSQDKELPVILDNGIAAAQTIIRSFKLDALQAVKDLEIICAAQKVIYG